MKHGQWQDATNAQPGDVVTLTFMQGDRLGRVPVDRCWAMDDLPELRAGWLAVYKGCGDHRFPVVEFDSKVLLGEHVLRIVCPPARRLACGIRVVKKETIPTSPDGSCQASPTS